MEFQSKQTKNRNGNFCPFESTIKKTNGFVTKEMKFRNKCIMLTKHFDSLSNCNMNTKFIGRYIKKVKCCYSFGWSSLDNNFYACTLYFYKKFHFILYSITVFILY